MKVNVNDLKESEFSTGIYNPDPDGGLIESIRMNGVIEPIVIDDSNVIISGHRRVNACKILGIDEIEATVREYSDLLVLEYNRYRQKNPEEIIAEARELEKYYKEIAKGYQSATQFSGKNKDGQPKYKNESVRLNLNEPNRKPFRTLQEVAKFLNMSESQLRKLYKIEQEAPEKLKEIGAGDKSVHQAYLEIKLKEQIIKEQENTILKKETRIKELSESVNNNEQFFKQTLQEIQQEQTDTLQQLSEENDRLRQQISQLESRLVPAEPVPEPEPFQPSGDNGQHRQQVIDLERVVADLNQEIVSLRESKASENINLMRRLKSDYETKEQDYQSTIEQLQQDIADLKSGVFPDEEIHYEPDDADTGIASFLSFLDRLDSSSNYDSQLVAQLEDIRNRIEVYLDRMQVDNTWN